ncbi:MAG: MOSC domain-containing protein [Planctomycetes bacterium]|nr:MOSC domain-containing protein [Planctomycetota bacterium]
MATIVSIVYSPPTDEPRPQDHYHRVPLTTAQLVVGHGIEGDRKGRWKGRELSLMSAETLAILAAEGFRTAPGELGEQLIIEGLDVNTLPQGARLQLGSTSIVEVTEPRTGCDRFEHIQGKFKGLVRGRFGVLTNVVQAGSITVGDSVQRVL